MSVFLKQVATSVLAKLIAQKTSILVSSASPILAGLLFYLRNEIAPRLADPTGWIALKSIIVSVVLFPLPFAAYFWFRPNFWFDEVTNTYIDRKTDIHYCTQCKHSENKKTPLGVVANGWECSVHKRFLPDPARPFPEETPRNYPADYPGY